MMIQSVTKAGKKLFVILILGIVPMLGGYNELIAYLRSCYHEFSTLCSRADQPGRAVL